MAPQFVVPQFIDVEDKIIGPITTRQFIMGVVAVFLLFLSYRLADTVLFIIQAVFVVGIYALIAFVKINGQPFYIFVLSMVRSSLRSSLRVWSKNGPQPKIAAKKQTKKTEDTAPLVRAPHPHSQALSELSLLVDTGGKFRPEEILAKASQSQNQNAKK